MKRRGSLHPAVFRRGCGLNEDQIKDGLQNIVGKHRSLNQVDAMKAKKGVAELLRVMAVMAINDRGQATPGWVQDYRTILTCFGGFCAWWELEGGAGDSKRVGGGAVQRSHLQKNCPRAQGFRR